MEGVRFRTFEVLKIGDKMFGKLRKIWFIAVLKCSKDILRQRVVDGKDNKQN